jgi:RNA polymerase sigma-54 factor
MAMAPRLEMRQGQTLVMTPQLQQAIKLLQLSNIELAEFIEAELERNPLLERVEAPSETPDDAPPADSGIDFDNAGAVENALDADMSDAHPDMSSSDLAEAGAAPMQDWSKASSGKSFDSLPDLEETLASDLSLAQHLDSQLSEAALTPVQRIIGAALIDQIDEWGYFRGRADETARALGCDEAEVDKVLAVMQGFEPTGIMARDVAECLALQLKERDRFDPAMQALIANLDLLAKGHMDRLCHVCSVDREDPNDMVGAIRALTPQPGLAFGGAP